MSGIFGVFTNKEIHGQGGISAAPMLTWNRIYGNSIEECCEKTDISLGCCVELLSEEHKQNKAVLTHGGKYAAIDAVLYNRDELLKKLKEYAHESAEMLYDAMSDAELLFAFFERFGQKALSCVNGDFAGAIYDESKKNLILFRDHMGIRPLYYYADDKLVAFSTDLRGLVAVKEVDAEISEDWIYKTIHGYAADTIDNTVFEHISCVTPASAISFSFSSKGLKCSKSAYWKLRAHKVRFSSENEYRYRLRELITDSVKRRLDAVQGTVGAELSGGLDSGVIDILINRLGRESVYYSWSLDPAELKMAENDERSVIADICRQEKMICNYAQKKSDYSQGVFEKMSEAGIGIPDNGSGDFRFAFPTGVNTYQLLHGAQFATSRGARAMFTGHGGDEGVSHRGNIYELFRYREYYHLLRNTWRLTAGQKHRVARTIRKLFETLKKGYKDTHEPYLDWYSSPELINPSFESSKKIKNSYRLQFAYDPVEYIKSGGSRNRLDNVALFGALGGVRYMVPYLDYRVIDFAVSIPRHLYFCGNKKRYIFREAFKDIMPESLYKVNIKEDTSIRNIEPDPDWFESYDARKKEIIGKLDRKYWERFIDFDKVEKLLQAGKPSDEEYLDEVRQQKVLLLLALARNLVERARS